MDIQKHVHLARCIAEINVKEKYRSSLFRFSVPWRHGGGNGKGQPVQGSLQGLPFFS